MATHIVRRLYFYAAAFIGLQILAFGAHGLLGLLLEQIFPSGFDTPESLALRLSTSAAFLLVGAPLWAIHWVIIQRNAHNPEEQKSTLRRLYGYAVLLLAMMTLLFGLRDLIDTLLGMFDTTRIRTPIAVSIATLGVHLPIWGYHWRIFSADRSTVEQTGGTATLRRWHLTLILAISLVIASYGAIDFIHRLLQLALGIGIGRTPGLGTPIASLIAGLAVWAPHHLWARRLVRVPTSLQEDEIHSTLRQVYMALVITITALAALASLAIILYTGLMAAFGNMDWAQAPQEITLPLATMLITIPLWFYHREQLAAEARLSAVEVREETAQRIVSYSTAAVGLAALFFGLGGSLSVLLQIILAPEVMGAGWSEQLSLYLALTIVALPVYGAMAWIIEGRARSLPTEERTLARRIYLYAALLFGIVATVSSVVVLLRLTIGALLGAAEPNMAVEIGRWAGYALIGAVIGIYHGMLLRRSRAVRGDVGAGATVVLVTDQPLQQTLLAAFERELPGATLSAFGADELTPLITALATADAAVVSLPAMLDGALAGTLQAFQGQRLLLTFPVEGYDLIGARRSVAAIAREAAQAVRTALSAKTQAEPPSAQPLVPQSAA
jgi:hypothetical protein